MLKWIVYTKMGHIGSARVIEDMTKYNGIYKFVSDRIKPSERSIQRYRDDLGHYYEVLVKMTFK